MTIGHGNPCLDVDFETALFCPISGFGFWDGRFYQIFGKKQTGILQKKKKNPKFFLEIVIDQQSQRTAVCSLREKIRFPRKHVYRKGGEKPEKKED